MKRIAIDMGSGVTKIYMSGCGVVLMEATCLAVEYDESGEGAYIKAFGDKARQLSGRSALNTHIVNPVFEGDIVNFELAVQLMRYFLEKIEITKKAARRTEAIFVLPCGIKKEQLARYSALAENLGFAASYYTQTPYAAVLGHNVTVGESVPTFSLDIGYSIANMGVFSQDGIISGLNVNLGGGNIDVHIMQELEAHHNIRIGALSAERLKNTVGSLLEDDNKMTVVDGREITSGAPSSVAINSEQIYGVITTYVDKILEYALLIISKLPAEVASAVMRGGVYLSGGLLKMDGLKEYIERKLNIPAITSEEPQLCAVIGGGTIISSDLFFEKFATEL